MEAAQAGYNAQIKARESYAERQAKIKGLAKDAQEEYEKLSS